MNWKLGYALRSAALALSFVATGVVLHAAEASAAAAAAQDSAPGGTFFGRVPEAAKCRHYYVAAEPVAWDYLPGSRAELCGDPAVAAPPASVDFTAAKLRYRQYTDSTFTTRMRETPSLGILGPVLRGVTGEFLVVHFLNRANQPLSMHPHGVRYDKDSEGAKCLVNPGRGAEVAPGASFTYVWQLDESSGPLPTEPSSKAWLYHSHVSGDDEINLGLVGAIIVTDPARARPDGTPQDVQREFATLFLLFDESGLGAEEREAYEYVDNGSGIPLRSWAETQELLERGVRSAINGRVFGSLAGLEMNEGERVRWYLFALGSERDFHTAHWHGLRVVEEGRRRTDVIELMPASMKVADAIADNPGDWLFHCHIADHLREGMYAKFTVFSAADPRASREPSRAFLGLHEATQTLRVLRTERVADSGALRVTAEVTVPDPLTVHRTEFRVGAGAGGASVVVRLSPEGTGRAEGIGLRVFNVRGGGVLHGGLARVELEIPRERLPVASKEAFRLTLSVDNAQHETAVVLP